MNIPLSTERSKAPGKPIRVVHVIFRLDIGGLENGLVNIINGLPDGQFEHTVICLDTFTDFRKRITRDGVQFLALNKKPGLDPLMYGRLWKLLRRLRPDIVHTRNLGTLPCVVVAAAAGVPVRIHGEHGWDMIDVSGEQFKYRWLRKLISPFVTSHVAVSRHIVDWLTNSVGIRASKILQIGNGVDTARFSPRSADDALPGRRELEGDSTTGRINIVVGTVGRLDPVKDQQNLIVALGLLRSQRPDLASGLAAIIVGDGSLEAELKRASVENRVASMVHLVGRQDDIPGYLRSMDIFVLPSLNEGISNTILEAMATGLPVIATAVGGNPEIVDDGRTGMLIPASDPQALARALIRYCDDLALRAKHGSAARSLVETSLSLASMVRNYQTLYEQSVGHPSGLQTES